MHSLPRAFRARRWTYLAATCVAVVLGAFVASCRDVISPEEYNADWTQASHGLSTPNYAVVFPQDSVNTIEISMSAAQWAGIRANMKALWGFDFGSHDAGPCCCPCPTEEPNWVDVTVRFKGKTWKNVGFRLKGNSSLEVTWDAGTYKLPFRLSFDEFEDTYAGVGDQRFYGFKEVTMSPGVFDASLIREKVAADLFRRAGVPAARTAFYKVYIDVGNGLKYDGIYTMVELIEDTMVRDQFGESGGNVYKPRSTFASFVQSEFAKQNNKTKPDYSDVQAAITALNSPLRTSNAAQWRANLEATFDANAFLRWLAVNNAMVSWDSYGVNAQNFYLYNHSTRKLVWIPWDQNFALTGNPPLAGAVPRVYQGGVGLSLTMNEVESSWPLIRFLMDDPTYAARYRTYMKSFSDDVFTQSRTDSLFDKYHSMISPYVVGTNGEQPGYTLLSNPGDFLVALQGLKDHVLTRRALVAEYLR